MGAHQRDKHLCAPALNGCSLFVVAVSILDCTIFTGMLAHLKGEAEAPLLFFRDVEKTLARLAP